MDEIKLRSFITVSQEGSFTKAADLLYLSPVAVKNQIDALEGELGEKVFFRKATGCTLTPVGEVFLKHADIILSDIDQAKSEVEKAGIITRGEIVAGHNITFNYKFVGALSSGFAQQKGNYIIQFEKYPKNELVSLLLNRQINCIFAESTLMGAKEDPDIVFYPMTSFQVYAIMRKGHALSKKKAIKLSDLKDQEVYVSSTLGAENLNEIISVTKDFKLIEEVDRNVLFNRIIKDAIEIYPRRFSYYDCIPVDIDPVVLGLFALKNHSKITETMIDYTHDFMKDPANEIEEIM